MSVMKMFAREGLNEKSDIAVFEELRSVFMVFVTVMNEKAGRRFKVVFDPLLGFSLI